MKRYIRKIILTIMWISILAIVPIVTFKYDNISYSNDVPYIASVVNIELMDINIDVNKDNSIDVTEAITFNLVDGTPFEGIRLNFPLRDNITIDGKNYKRNLSLGDISSEDVSIDKKKSFNYLEAHLGKNNKDMQSGLYTYTLKYHYNLGNNTDDFIYKVFSNKYNIDVFNMNLVVNFKEKIDKDKVRFISNNNDATKNITYGVEENVIRASMNDFILDNDLIVDVDLDDYFDNAKSTDGFVTIAMLIIIIFSTIALIVISILKHKKSIDAKETYNLDIKCIMGLLGLVLLEVLLYLFINDLKVKMYFIFYIVYSILFLTGLILIGRLKDR